MVILDLSIIICTGTQMVKIDLVGLNSVSNSQQFPMEIVLILYCLLEILTHNKNLSLICKVSVVFLWGF